MSKSERYYYDFDAVQEHVEGGAHARRAGPNAMRGQGSNRPEGGGRANREGRDMPTVGQKTPTGWNTGVTARKLATAGSGTKNNDSMDEALSEMRDSRNRRSVWTVASAPYKGAHFATYPPKLIEPCILAGAPAGGVVLDIFMGSGTTAQVAELLCDTYLGWERMRGAMRKDGYDGVVEGPGYLVPLRYRTRHTCDAPLCKACATPNGTMFVNMKHTSFSESIDYCPGHDFGSTRDEITGLQAASMRARWRAAARASRLQAEPCYAEQGGLFSGLLP